MPVNKTVLFSVVIAMVLPVHVLAWGVDGHRIVGEYALQWLDESSRSNLREILGGDSPEHLERACNWPDKVRKTPEWEWSSPLHFVNIPRSAHEYNRERDCPDGKCVTEAIIDYAQQLDSGRVDGEERWQALAWLCHLVGDLHQPLHAGYQDDRGANNVPIRYRGEAHDLHEFWDTTLPRSRLGSQGQWNPPLDSSEWPNPPNAWYVSDVAAWTSQSHALVASSAYPASNVIDESFAESRWLIVRQQWQHAGYRLATILNAVIGNGQVELER